MKNSTVLHFLFIAIVLSSCLEAKEQKKQEISDYQNNALQTAGLSVERELKKSGNQGTRIKFHEKNTLEDLEQKVRQNFGFVPDRNKVSFSPDQNFFTSTSQDHENLILACLSAIAKISDFIGDDIQTQNGKIKSQSSTKIGNFHFKKEEEISDRIFSSKYTITSSKGKLSLFVFQSGNDVKIEFKEADLTYLEFFTSISDPNASGPVHSLHIAKELADEKTVYHAIFLLSSKE